VRRGLKEVPLPIAIVNLHLVTKPRILPMSCSASRFRGWCNAGTAHAFEALQFPQQGAQEMVRHAIGPMILAASILAVPVLAATSNDAPNNSPAAASSAPTNNMGAGMTATRPAESNAVGTTADNNATPRYATSDGQVRIGKIVGASVYNDQKESIGSVDDVLLSSNDKAATAVLSVGGFLGMGSKLVSVPFAQLKIQNNRIVMPGATKASLNSMPAYQFNKNA
jgi:hypothetical protein